MDKNEKSLSDINKNLGRLLPIIENLVQAINAYSLETTKRLDELVKILDKEKTDG